MQYHISLKSLGMAFDRILKIPFGISSSSTHMDIAGQSKLPFLSSESRKATPKNLSHNENVIIPLFISTYSPMTFFFWFPKASANGKGLCSPSTRYPVFSTPKPFPFSMKGLPQSRYLVVATPTIILLHGYNWEICQKCRPQEKGVPQRAVYHPLLLVYLADRYLILVKSFQDLRNGDQNIYSGLMGGSILKKQLSR